MSKSVPKKNAKKIKRRKEIRRKGGKQRTSPVFLLFSIIPFLLIFHFLL
jgi:hypothetical protein